MSENPNSAYMYTIVVGSLACVTAFGVFNNDNNLIDLNIDNLCKVCKMVGRFCQQQFEFNQIFVSYIEENTQYTFTSVYFVLPRIE